MLTVPVDFNLAANVYAQPQWLFGFLKGKKQNAYAPAWLSMLYNLFRNKFKELID